MRYAIVVEKAANNYSAYVPDLPTALLLAIPLRKLSKKFVKQSNFISKE
jgi:hypothetical protein